MAVPLDHHEVAWKAETKVDASDAIVVDGWAVSLAELWGI